MLSVRFSRCGVPDDVLRVDEIPVPEPGNGEVRIRLSSRPINYSDITAIEGRGPSSLSRSSTAAAPPAAPISPSPRIPGLQAAGVIEASGPGAALPPGQRVVVRAQGTWQETMVVPTSAVFAVPAGLSDDMASLAFLALTATLLLNDADAPPASWLVLTGAGSSIGHALVQLARLRGLHTLCVVRRAEQGAALRAIGADEILVDDEDLAERAATATGGERVAVVLDAVSGQVGGRALSTLSEGGTHIIYGELSGEPLPVPPPLLVYRRLTVRGFSFGRWLKQTEAATLKTHMDGTLRLLADGRLVLPIEARYPLVEAREAVAHARRPGRAGKILLVG